MLCHCGVGSWYTHIGFALFLCVPFGCLFACLGLVVLAGWFCRDCELVVRGLLISLYLYICVVMVLLGLVGL